MLDLLLYNKEQLRQIYLCPINRHGTRREHGVDDWGLYRNPKLLEDHWFKHGGAEAFAKRRSEFEKKEKLKERGEIKEPEWCI